MEIVIFVIALVAIIAFLLYRKRLSSKGQILSKIVNEAMSEFDSISNFGKQASEQDIQEYRAKYAELSEKIRKFRFSKMMTQQLFDSFGIGEYMVFYATIDKHYKENNRINNEIQNLDSWCDKAVAELNTYLDEDHYFTFSELKLFQQHNTFEIESFKKLFAANSKYFYNPKAPELFAFITDMESMRTQHNKQFEKSQLVKYEDYFDNVLSYSLDKQQRDAIVCLEDNTLVISSAGSGKTSTIIGKARYLLDIRKIDPSKLLIVTYTRKSASELYDRLGIEEVECCTFHSLAVKILAQVENKKPSICSQSLLLNTFSTLMRNNKQFLSSVLHYLLHLQSLMKLEHEYSKAPDYFADRKKYGIQAPYTDMNDRIIFTRSEEEKRICTYLTELGVNFVYEQPYEYNTYTKDYRQYLPDFTIYVTEQTVNPETGAISTRVRRVYLEHFAIDKDGNVPKWFGDKDPKGGWYAQNRKYNDGIQWKRSTHKEHHTTLIETRSADFHSGRIMEVLKEQLSKARVPYREVPSEELYARLVKRSPKVEKSVFVLLEQFIALVKSNCPTFSPFTKLIETATEKHDTRTLAIINDIVLPLYTAYSDELKRLGQIDFTDAINLASDYCAMEKWKDYDYILVDEFQDISVDRYNFLQCLRKRVPMTKMFCVGDDWQSIYRFAGSNMRLFYKFEEYFGFTEHRMIESTYRFCNPLLELSSEFIQRNPEQVRKSVVPFVTPIPKSRNEKGVPTRYITVDGVVYPYHEDEIPMVQEWIKKNHTYIDFVDCGASLREDDDDRMYQSVQKLVRYIPADESILILGRYNYDAFSVGYVFNKADINSSPDNIYVNIEGRKIRFMSVHSAKGLEADNVILINCEEGQNGFPSLIEDDPILGYVLSEEDQFEYAEERRLFYVAITRAKRHTYVLYHGDKPSPFVRELSNIVSPQEHICPLCQQGHIVVMKEGTSKNGVPFKNYGCSNSNAGCEYFERVFGDNIPNFVKFNQAQRQQTNGSSSELNFGQVSIPSPSEDPYIKLAERLNFRNK